MGITLVIFRDFVNILFPKDRFIKFARGTLTVLSSTFKSFVGILLGPVVFSIFNVFIKDCTSLVLEKTFFREDCQGSLSIFYPFVQFFSDCSKELVKVITYYKWVSCLLIIYFKTVYVFFLFFAYV